MERKFDLQVVCDDDQLKQAAARHGRPPDTFLVETLIKGASSNGLFSLMVASDNHIDLTRRYALLQAAATILAGSLLKYDACEVSVQPKYWENAESAVDSARQLLAEIEKLEAAR